jgi:hypothetical protein
LQFIKEGKGNLQLNGKHKSAKLMVLVYPIKMMMMMIMTTVTTTTTSVCLKTQLRNIQKLTVLLVMEMSCLFGE